jgi:hypothetical protein
MIPADERITKKVAFVDILNTVAEYYQIAIDDLLSETRTKELSEPRQVIMYLARQFTEGSTTTIGKRLGGRDHSTVVYGSSQIKKRLIADGENRLRLTVRHIAKSLAETTEAEVNFSFNDNLKIFSEESPSEEFCNVIFDTGTDYAVCEACGRVFFNDNPVDEMDNLDNLRQLAQTNPDQYHNLGNSAVSVGELDGISAVYNCPCNFLRKYERLFHNNRYKILRYFQARHRIIQDKLDEETALIRGAE